MSKRLLYIRFADSSLLLQGSVLPTIKAKQAASPSDTLLGSEARAQRVSELSASRRPFAAGGIQKSWLDEASSPVKRSAAPRAISTLAELPKDYSPSKAEFTGDSKFDQAAEEQTRMYLAGISSHVDGSPQPFAVGKEIPGWREAASLPVVRLLI